MTLNNGLPFELINQEIFSILINQDSVRNIEVNHDVVLQGITATHQVDVYWEFEMGGITYKTVVQSKDWAKRIDQGELLKFRAVLDDLPGQPRGIVVTSYGYQSGAREYAKAHGILIFELTEKPGPPPIEMVEGSFGTFELRSMRSGVSEKISGPIGEHLGALVMRFVGYDPSFSFIRFEFDSDWFAERRQRYGTDALLEFVNFRLTARPRDITLYDAAENPIGSVQDILTPAVHAMNGTGDMTKPLVEVFASPTYLRTKSSVLPYIKITGITTTITLTKREPIERPLRMANIVSFVLKNINEGTERVIEIEKPPPIGKIPE